MQLFTFVYGNDFYMLAENTAQVWLHLGWNSFNPDYLQIFWTTDKHIELYAVWNMAHVEKLLPNTPVYFKSTHPFSRFIYVVETMEDVIEFDPELPAFINHVRLFGHIPGINPYAFDIKFIYKIASINYGYFDWLWNWF